MKKTFYMVARIEQGVDPRTGEIAFSFEQPKRGKAKQTGDVGDDTVIVSSQNLNGNGLSINLAPTAAHRTERIAITEAQRLAEEEPSAHGFAVLRAVAFVSRPKGPATVEGLK